MNRKPKSSEPSPQYTATELAGLSLAAWDELCQSVGLPLGSGGVSPMGGPLDEDEWIEALGKSRRVAWEGKP